MKYEEPQPLPSSDPGRVLPRDQHSDYRARGKGRSGRHPRGQHRIYPTVVSKEGDTLCDRDLEDVRASSEVGSCHLGRFNRRADLQGGQCGSVLQSRRRGNRPTAVLAWGFVALFLLTAGLASAQPYGQSPGNLLDQYRVLRPTWFAAVTGAANRLFGLLALIEFAWSAAVLVLERTDLQGWTASLIKRMMFVGAFYALLVNGPTWIPAIIDSFQIVGQNAAGLGAGLSPGEVFLRGLDIAVSIASTSSVTGFFVNPAGAFILVLSALIVFLAFVVISVHFIMALVESYVVVGAGFIFLGFGGSRWTAPYVERYIALAVAVGVKIMVLYLLIGGGITISAGWVARANSISGLLNPLMDVLDIVGGSVVFMALCWQAPKFTASLLGGSPAFSGGDIAAIGLAGAQTAFVVGSLGAGAAKLLAARGAAGAMGVSQAAGMGAGGNAASGGAAGSAGVPGSGGMPSSGTGGGRGSGGSPSGGSGGTGDQTGSKGSGQPPPPNNNGSSGSANGSSPNASNGSSGGPSQQKSAAPAGSNNTTPASAANDNSAVSARASNGSGPVTQSLKQAAPASPPPMQQLAGSAGSAANDAVFHADQLNNVAAVGGNPSSAPPPASGVPPAGLDSPQTVSAPMANSSPMDINAPMGVGANKAPTPPTSATSQANGQTTSSPNGTLDNPQTTDNPQTVSAPMTNSSPMTNASPMADQTANRPPSQVPPPPSSLAERLEGQFDRAANRTAMLRQALPADGHAGSPAALNLNGGE